MRWVWGPSVVVRRATKVVWRRRHPLELGLLACDVIAPVAQDVAHVAVVPGAQLQRQRAGGLHAQRPIALGQTEQAQTAAVAVLRMAEAAQQLGDEVPGVRADAGAPVDQPLGRPL